MAVGEIFLAAFISLLISRLLPAGDLLTFVRGQGIGKKLKKWEKTLTAIRAVLLDAEEKQLKNEAVKVWLDDLRDLIYDVDDVLDKFFTEMLRREVNEQNDEATTSKVRCLCFCAKVKFQFDMNSEIEKITETFQDITTRKLDLNLTDTVATPSKAWRRTPVSSLPDGMVPIVGRDGDKAKIVEFLSREGPNNTVNYNVLAIVGMAGVGKTTLAQYVFNDADVVKPFNIMVWVSVSDEFDIGRVTKAILESVTQRGCDLQEFTEVQKKLAKELEGKRFLIILDDVWKTCKYDLWTSLQAPFHFGATGSKVVLTTRDEEVAKVARAVEVHKLEYMSDDDCWKVFARHASFEVEDGRPPNFELHREKIVAKCGGLPLAASTLGGFLGSKDMEEWDNILSTELWSLYDGSVLKLSYHYLPSNLKRCFAYCSILPNDYEFGKKQLILLWMAEGFLQQPNQSKEMEDLGDEYFEQLLSLSYFQKSSKNKSRYVMHDLVGELARWAAGDICFRLEDKRERGCFPKSRHSSYSSGFYDGLKRFEAFFDVRNLRTFLPISVSSGHENYITPQVTLDLLPKLEYLRVLSFNGYQISELPESSIDKLKHLRYLDLSHTLLRSLPESTSTLYNLQTLILEHCSKLEALPASMRHLTNLRHLNNSDVPSLEGMPPLLGQLTNLQTLSNFVVSKSSDSRIGQIGPLVNLRGTLCLSRMENVTDVEDARRVNLSSKTGLDSLKLEWSGGEEKESEVLDWLKPHRNLKELTIKGYGGLQFSTWIGLSLFSSMTVVRLENCTNCQFLPPLGQLPHLREVDISGMHGVEVVGLEFYGGSSLPFPQLETLRLKDMQQWKTWNHPGVDVFLHVKMLCIDNCPKLQGRLPETLNLLSKLEISNCQLLVISIANYTQLRAVSVDHCRRMVHTSAVEFELLEHVRLSHISEFRLHEQEFMRGLTSVKHLEISGCEELTFSWKNEDRQYMNSVRDLVITSNSHLVQLLHLMSLQRLHIYGCQSVVSFPDASWPPSLKQILIQSCHSLIYLARKQIASSLRTLKIIGCKNLKSLVEEELEGSSSSFNPHLVVQEEEASCLERLEILECSSLISLSFKGELPRSLKFLYIDTCEKLESIAERVGEDTHLEQVFIHRCEKFKSLPEGICNLTNLQSFTTWNCPSLVSFPRGGFPTRASNLTYIAMPCGPKYLAVPKLVMHNLNFLQKLTITYCEGFGTFLQNGGFPPNLIELYIFEITNCKVVLDWGLDQLTSLRMLWINGAEDMVSFPPKREMVLPNSLTKLVIEYFNNLTELSNGIQFLTSLENLHIWNCPELASIPDEGLPLSLAHLNIYECPLLQERCKPGGQYWPMIANIPYIHMESMTTGPSPSYYSPSDDLALL